MSKTYHEWKWTDSNSLLNEPGSWVQWITETEATRLPCLLHSPDSCEGLAAAEVTASTSLFLFDDLRNKL